MKIFGDPSLGEEIVNLLHEWDNAIVELDFQNALQLCVPELCFFDLSTELHDRTAYEQKWNFYKPYRLKGVTIQRHDVTIYVETNLAFIHGYVKISPANAKNMKGFPQVHWCRSTHCLKKEQGQWKMVHQHISVPVQLETREMRQIKSVS